MKHTQKQAHEFALYTQLPHNFAADSLLTITNEAVVHRVNHVLRMQKGDQFILFNDLVHFTATINQLDKKSFTVTMSNITKNEPYTPTLIVELGLLKRESLDVAVHDLAVLGVNEIRLFVSEKVHRSWGGVQEYDRLCRCMITAAEQSKAFVLPRLVAPISFEQMFEQKSDGAHVVCDSVGELLVPVISGLPRTQPITVLIGPEGDLTETEKQRVCTAGYTRCRLTPTILRSESAAALAAGIIRSLFE